MAKGMGKPVKMNFKASTQTGMYRGKATARTRPTSQPKAPMGNPKPGFRNGGMVGKKKGC